MLLQVSVKKLNRRSSVPANFVDKTNIIGTVQQGFKFEGEEVPVTNSALGKWYKDAAGSFYWGGGVIMLPTKVISNFRDLPINLPSNFKFGIDVSHNNANPDWRTFKSAGCEFVFIKISEGVGTPDLKASANSQNAAQQGFRIGYYHFCHPDVRNGGTIQSDATAEANDALSRMRNLPAATLPFVLDLEVKNTVLTPTQYLLWVNTFVNAISPHISTGVMIYSTKDYLDSHLPHTHDLGKHKLWIARYPERPDVNNIAPAIGWKDWSIWQYKDKGIIGTSAPLDLNIMKDSSLF